MDDDEVAKTEDTTFDPLTSVPSSTNDSKSSSTFNEVKPTTLPPPFTNPPTAVSIPTTIVQSSTLPPSTDSVSSTSTDRSNSSTDILFSDEDQSGQRVRRSTSEQTKFNGPSASLRSDLSHQEEKEKIEEPPSSDDVKKVYLLQNDQNRNTDLELSGTPHQFASLAAKVGNNIYFFILFK